MYENSRSYVIMQGRNLRKSEWNEKSPDIW